MPPILLIVEDEDSSRTALAELLRDEGYVVHEARSGADALESVRTNGLPDAAIVDVQLPDMDGLAVMATLEQQGASCAFICVSGSAELEVHDDGARLVDHEARALACGAAAYLPKPIDYTALLAALSSITVS